MRTKYKPWAKPYIEEHSDVMLSLTDAKNISDIYLEIGSGKGAFLVGMAKKFPHINFVGIERNVTCCGFTCKKLVEEAIPNAKLYFGDASVFLADMKESSVNKIYLNFSDPWPKIRHHKRRLTSDKILPLYKKILSFDGEIILKTDNLDLFTFSIEMFENNSFRVVSKDMNYILNEDIDFITEYEAGFRKDNLPIYRLVAKHE